MKILHVIGWLAPRYGGTSEYVLKACPQLQARGHAVEIVTTNVDGPGELDVRTGRPLDWAGLTTTFHPLSTPRGFLTSWPLLSDLLRRVASFDVVHIHGLYRFHTIAAARAARRRGVPYVVQAHGSLDPWHRQQRRRAKDAYHLLVENGTIQGAAAVLCTSEREEDSIRNLGYATPTRVVPVGIDVVELRAPVPETALVKRAGLNADAQIVTFLGRISAKKGLDLLLDAFRECSEFFPDAHLVVAGPDDEGIWRRLAPKVSRTGLSPRVSFVGTVSGEEKRALLQRSSVFVLPSADESFGIAVAEAMAVGCPVVVTPQVALADVVSSNGAGLIADREPRSIAHAIKEILARPSEAKTMGEAGMRAIDDRFAWPRVAADLETMYEDVLLDARRPRHDPPPPPRDAAHLPSFVCPVCRASLRLEGETYICEGCDRRYPVIDGIPVLVPDLDLIEHDEIDHQAGESHAEHESHKAGQASHFDREVAEEFEIRRPHGTPLLYRYLLREKFRRAVEPLRLHLRGATVLTVCGGSGMDAEFLARMGARVVSSDLSLGAARRSRERARRYGLDITSIVADVECLPFPQEAFDMVFVHDGLHHLEKPEKGLAEMARVAAKWLSLTEPSRAAITSFAVRLGLAKEREEAGNKVARLSSAHVTKALQGRDYRTLAAKRYAMYYPHEPGPVFEFLSLRPIFPFVQAAWKLTNSLFGRIGNKLVVIAERRSSHV